jgi:hypothetical protein
MTMSDKITWTNDKRKLSELIPWEINPAQIGKDEARRLEESLDEFGQVQAIAISPTNEIYDGHQRKTVWSASKKFGKDYVVDVRVSSRPLTEQERKKLVIYLRKGAVGEFDWDLLANNFDVPDLLEWGFSEQELQIGGFDLDGDKPEDPGAQVDKADELRQKWGTETGQLWQLGEHKLICGDCTDRAVVDKLMGGEIAAITFTSPPYNAGVSAQLSGNTSIDDNLYKDEYDDNQSQENYLILLQGFTDNALLVSKYTFVNIQVLAGNKRAFVDYMALYRDKFADVAIWDKGHAAPAAAQRVMDSRFEFVLIFSEQANRAIGTRDFRGMVHNVYDGNPQRHNDYAGSHAATFPVDFPEHFIETFTNKGEVIFEPFDGTGTTLIACERLGRKCRAIEISPAYVAVALQRFYDMTGVMPELITS